MSVCVQCGANLRANSHICQQCGHRNPAEIKENSKIPLAPPPKKVVPPPRAEQQKHNPRHVEQARDQAQPNGVNKALLGLVLLLVIVLGAYYLKNTYSINTVKEDKNNVSNNSSSVSRQSKITSDKLELPLPKPTEATLPEKIIAELEPFNADQYLKATMAGDWAKVESLIASNKVTPLSKGNRKVARTLNEQAIQELKNKNPSKAVELLSNALAEDPSDMEVRNNLGFSQLKSGDLANAKKTYLETLSYNPIRAIAWGNLAEIYADEGSNDLAAAALRLEVYLASDKKKIIASLQKIIESEDPEMKDNKLTKIIARELKNFSDIPDRK